MTRHSLPLMAWASQDDRSPGLTLYASPVLGGCLFGAVVCTVAESGSWLRLRNVWEPRFHETRSRMRYVISKGQVPRPATN